MTVRAPSSLHSPHAPVMLHEMLASLNIRDGARFVDGTFGAGGYTRAILDAAECHVYAIDRDGTVEKFADALRASHPKRFTFLSGAFGDMERLLADAGVDSVDGIVLDIGVSSMQLDEAERGFSFKRSGPLDMRMAQTGVTAAEFVNNASEADLTDIISHYGEERAAKRIAKAIVAARAEAPFETTHQLAALVAKTIGRGNGKIDPATRTFQALRIYVNDELGELVRALEAAEKLLAPNGRLVVVTFHSLEDRIVKRFFQSRTGNAEETFSRHVPVTANANAEKPSFTQPTRKALAASEEEAAVNPRSRSAKLRWGIRTDAPAMTEPFIPAKEIRHAIF
ncbi:MAG: 16S rRNA (cytosine(1402)-N(4))-methyltransferase RsmH [Alphaproteobacteria bacterium]|nr:16S rRNA (cytosine(1402)-N(4))-methyltransferase RsmH [Alphaproteobacteria bacterium]